MDLAHKKSGYDVCLTVLLLERECLIPKLRKKWPYDLSFRSNRQIVDLPVGHRLTSN